MRYPIVPLVLAAAMACSESAPPPPPTEVAAVVTTTLPARVVGSTLTEAPTFEVRAANGRALRVPVTVAVTSGGGTLTQAPSRSLRGPTPIGQWTLGTTAGPQTVTVTVPALPPLVFTVEASAAAPSALDKVTTQEYRSLPSVAFAGRLEVRLRDAFNNGIRGQAVTWSVEAGDGSLEATASVTDSTGVAAAPTWTLGSTDSGVQRLRASVGTLVQTFEVQLAEPASIVVDAAPPATIQVGTVTTTAARFTVRDAENVVIAGVPVSVSVTAGGGELTAAPSISQAEPISVGTWRMGTVAGPQAVTVSVAGLAPLEISTLGVAGPPSSILLVEGNGVSVVPGRVVPASMRVQVRDAFSNPVSGATLQWNVFSGGGTIEGSSTTVADAEGLSALPTWQTGVCGGPQRLRAVSGVPLGEVAVGLTETYALEVRYTGSEPQGAIKTAFDRACERVREVIVGTLPAVQFPANFNANACVTGLVINGEVIPGLRIYSTVENIDGPGGVLGSAGPCYTRQSSSLPVVGRMRFDSADLENLANQGRLDAVIVHEMLHVIGIGTLWTTRGLLQGSAPGSTPFFTGALARAACVDEHDGAQFCSGGVPAEDCLNLTQTCGQGTINSHWKESVFRSELMTGFLSAGENPFSRMSIQSLADLGYTVNAEVADPYTVPPPALMSLIPAWTLRLPEPTGPLASIDEQGRVTPLPMLRHDH